MYPVYEFSRDGRHPEICGVEQEGWQLGRVCFPPRGSVMPGGDKCTYLVQYMLENQFGGIRLHAIDVSMRQS